MSTDVPPAAQSRPQPRSTRPDSSSGRWWRRGLLVIGILAVVSSAAALIRGAASSRQNDPKLTHTITRGDLIVTVTAQGTLESSENTEIKCKVRGARIPIIWVIENGTEVKPGDELFRLATLEFDDRVSEMSKYLHMTRSAAERSKANVARAELAIPQYLEGTYRSELLTLEKDLAIAESNLTTAQNMLAHAEMLAERGYASELDVEEKAFALKRAKLSVGVKNTQIDVLKDFTKAMQLETLNGNLKASKARHEANKERTKSLAAQVDRSLNDVEHCAVKAEKAGLVIYPAGEPWSYVPKIEEGVNVYMGQTLLLMPDLSQMQVKVGIRERIVDRIKPGLSVKVTLPNKTLDAEVFSVASVAKPARWWTANIVRYDTIIKLPPMKHPMPGMSAEVQIIIGRHKNVLMIPVAAVVETEESDFCLVNTAKGTQRRRLTLGDTNDMFTVVKEGLKEGDQVVLNTLAFFEQAQAEGLKPLNNKKGQEPKSADSDAKAKPKKTSP